MTKKNTIFRLQGGLGNQLFIYFAGLYFEQIANTTVTFDISLREKGFTNHGSKIETLGLPVHLQKIDFPWNILSRMENSLQVRGVSGFKWVRSLTSNRNWITSEVGYSGDLSFIPKGASVSGYFQSYLYPDGIPKSRRTIPESRKIQFVEEVGELNKIALAERPIIVHVRRGDYLKVKETIGLLDRNYYKKAIGLSQEINPTAPLWVFSDEIEAAKEIMTFKTRSKIKFVNVPKNDPTNTLLLMSLGGGHVISNSTFAWWGSYLSENSEFTLAPSSWFKNYPAPLELCPPNWELTPSSWE